MRNKVALYLFLFQLVGCGQISVKDLNDSSLSTLAPSITKIAQTQELLYQTKTHKELKIRESLVYTEGNSFSGYRLTLQFINNGSNQLKFSPRISLKDHADIPHPVKNLHDLLKHASLLAKMPIPNISYSPNDTSYHSHGVITTSSGAQYNYSEYGYSSTNTNAVDNFSAGYAQGVAIKNMRTQQEGLEMLTWASENWLHEYYELMPGESKVGVLFFESSQIDKLPIIVDLYFGQEKVTFISREN